MQIRQIGTGGSGIIPFNIFYVLLRPLLTGVSIFAVYYTMVDEYQDMISSRFTTQEDTFDFVIVGGGSSGSVLASRLSENFKVLLLEAGGQANPFTAIPLFAFIFHGNIPEDYKYKTVSQKYSGFGLKDNKVIWHSGRGLGGSSLIHGMIYIRGNVQGFNSLAEKTGDQIWNKKNVLKYYKAIEDYHGFFESADHGQGGQMSIEKSPLSSFTYNLFNATEELGYNVSDPNSDEGVLEGAAPMDLYSRDGGRWSAYDGYIKPIMYTRRNLTIRKFSNVQKVLLDANNVATGVEYFRHGSIHIAKAKKEVILSAGAVQTPKILMLSGIGPKSHLEELKIPVKVNLPVGEKLQDKYGAVVGPFLVDKGNSYLLSRDFLLSEYMRWFFGRTGSQRSSRAESSYSITSEVAKREKREYSPDIHTYVISLPIDEKLEEPVYMNGLNFKSKFIKSYIKPYYGKESFVQLVMNSKPQGHGKLRLRDSNPASPVLLDPMYLNDPRDLETLVEGIKFSVKLVEETKSFQKINAHLIPAPVPGCEEYVMKSDPYWECLAKTTTATAFKYCATAPIGKNTSDPFAVVDSRLRVFGVKNLRVIDGSVLEESMVSVNHVTCQVLGEMASEFITNEYLN